LRLPLSFQTVKKSEQEMAMLTVTVAAGLALFFGFVFHICAPIFWQNAGARPDCIDINRKSPFGGWRY
jgi:hypothetical protein